MRSPLSPALRAAALTTVLPLALATGCAASDGTDATAATPTSSTPSAGPTGTAEESEASAPTEVGGSAPRLALTYDGGVQVLDATTLEVLADEPLEGFNRLNPAGDGRHFLVSTSGGFRLLDGGAWGEPHGDHDHYYTADPELTDVLFAAEKPAHVVAHAGRTVLFDDGTGDVTAFDSADIADPDREVLEFSTSAPHHGVAVELADGRMLVSDGTEEERSGIRILDADGEEITARDDCPSVHGEAVAADEAVVIGCQDGAVLYADGELTKIQSPDEYGRIGNQFGTESSPIVLGDYERSAEDRSSTVALLDTTTASLRLVDLPAPYWYRSFGRGPNGEGLVLTYDGALQVIDPVTGTVTRSIPVTGAWEESDDWQDPHPNVVVVDGMAYVTDPATQQIHAVDVEAGEVWKSASLDVTPNELSGVSGDVEEHADHDHEHDGEQAHDDEHDE
ncbi:zinc metallochaperone AztD [Blastococcus sp. VKM Ac-2987]|uniref:zinc metallochaperone AztD n=1 Tax=Blastococcus sp. VKM Ac-2987 TaxID=3004141 RepID=UPI0022AB920E|nr:zinc metallochaperone AztD [Blastococcus sp. VKM Ac-2987]MCZ2860497.1 zinc metallochaperone AztD [Blastococcus sp. VKM Ac-2987]